MNRGRERVGHWLFRIGTKCFYGGDREARRGKRVCNMAKRMEDCATGGSKKTKGGRKGSEGREWELQEHPKNRDSEAENADKVGTGYRGRGVLQSC